jgi:hypothetical protein
MATPRKRIVTVPIDHLRVTFNVRTSLDQDRVVQLALLYEAKHPVELIKITRDNEVVDGRTRIEAMRLAGLFEAQAEIVEEHERVALLGLALRSNMGGAQQATKADIVFTIQQMLEAGAKQGTIINALQPYPPSAVRRWYTDAIHDRDRRKLTAAKAAVAEGGMKMKEAATKFQVEEEDLRAALMGEKKKKTQVGLASLKGRVTNIYRSHAQTFARQMIKLHDDYRDGVVAAETIDSFLDAWEAANRRIQSNIFEWRTRTRNLVKGVSVGAAAAGGDGE